MPGKFKRLVGWIRTSALLVTLGATGAAICPGAASAQWKAHEDNDGVFAGATASVSTPDAVAQVFCYGLLPGQEAPRIDATTTKPGTVIFAMNDNAFFADTFQSGPVTAKVQVDNLVWTVPFAHIGPEGIVAWTLGLDDPFLTSLRTGKSLTVTSPIARMSIPLRGSKAALDRVIGVCRSRFAAAGTASGQPVGGAATAAAGLWTERSLRDEVARSCAEFGPGAPQIEPGLIEAVSIDGDGVPDYLVNLSKLICSGDGLASDRQGAGSCASLGCGLQVWVSSLGRGKPALSTQGFDLVAADLGGGRADIYVIGNGMPCKAPSQDFSCANRMVWKGGALTRVGGPMTMAKMRAMAGQ